MGLFNRKKSNEDESDDLPVSLSAAIAGMTVIWRGMEDNEGRTLLCFAGEQMASWHHTPEETRRRILAGWKGLNETQLTQALRAINGKIRASMKEAASARKRKSWAGWQPLRSSLYPEIKDYE
jgi:hypothetical protein